LEDRGIDWRVVLKWVLKYKMGEWGMDSFGSGYVPVSTNSCEYINERLDFINGGKFIGKL
jgi:hypothetical protein